MASLVYLDTQDYIKIFNEAATGPNNLVLNELLKARDCGEIVIGFSFVTIMEFITKPDLSNRAERVRRGELIARVCGKNAFPYITDMANGATFPNGGNWMLHSGEKVISARSFRKRMRREFELQIAKQNVNRHIRRKLLRNGSMDELFKQSGTVWGRKRSDLGDIPVSDEFIESRVVERFFKGQCSDADLENRLSSWLYDPAEYSRIVYDYGKMPNVIEKFFGEPINKIEKIAAEIQSTIEGITKLNSEKLDLRRDLIELGISKRIAKEHTKQVRNHEVDFNANIGRLEAVCGVGKAGHFGHYFREMSKPNFSFKKSDVMDLMQLTYAYECDHFRCDKAMANTFRDFEPFKGKLVSRFADLRDRITRASG